MQKELDHSHHQTCCPQPPSCPLVPRFLLLSFKYTCLFLEECPTQYMHVPPLGGKGQNPVHPIACVFLCVVLQLFLLYDTNPTFDFYNSWANESILSEPDWKYRGDWKSREVLTMVFQEAFFSVNFSLSVKKERTLLYMPNSITDHHCFLPGSLARLQDSALFPPQSLNGSILRHKITILLILRLESSGISLSISVFTNPTSSNFAEMAVNLNLISTLISVSYISINIKQASENLCVFYFPAPSPSRCPWGLSPGACGKVQIFIDPALFPSREYQ